MPKRGQVSQVFVFILAAFIIGLTVLLGARLVLKATGIGDEVKIANFKSDFQADISSINYLDSRTVSYSVPSALREVCFVDFEESCTGCPFLGDYRLIDAGDKSRNAYFFFRDRVETLSISGMDVGCCYFQCFKPRSGHLKFNLEGIGFGRVLVEGG